MALGNVASSRKLIFTLYLQVSVRTVQRALKADGSLTYKRIKKVPAISQKNRKKRLERTLKMQVEKDDWWNQVLFEDEKSFNKDGSDGWACKWRLKNSTRAEFYRRHSGGGGVMVLIALSSKGCSPIVEITSKIHSLVYNRMLDNNLKHIAKRLVPKVRISARQRIRTRQCCSSRTILSQYYHSMPTLQI